MLERLHGKKGYLKKIDNAEMYAMIQFKMPLLTFCYKPNLIGLAALHMALKSLKQPEGEQPLIELVNSLLCLTPEVLEKLEVVKTHLANATTMHKKGEETDANIAQIKQKMEAFIQGEGKNFSEWLLVGKMMKEKESAWDSDDDDA